MFWLTWRAFLMWFLLLNVANSYMTVIQKLARLGHIYTWVGKFLFLCFFFFFSRLLKPLSIRLIFISHRHGFHSQPRGDGVYMFVRFPTDNGTSVGVVAQTVVLARRAIHNIRGRFVGIARKVLNEGLIAVSWWFLHRCRHFLSAYLFHISLCFMF